MESAPMLLPKPPAMGPVRSPTSTWDSGNQMLASNGSTRMYDSSKPGIVPSLPSHSGDQMPLPILGSNVAQTGQYSTASDRTASDWGNWSSNTLSGGYPHYNTGYSTISSRGSTAQYQPQNWSQTVGKYTSAAQLVTRRRAVRACRHCRRRKIRCSGANQSKDGRCENCERAGLERCIFSSVSTEQSKDVPSNAMWQQSSLPPDVQLCNSYDTTRGQSRQSRPPGFPPILWGAQQTAHHTIGAQMFSQPQQHSSQQTGLFPLFSQNGTARKRSYNDTSMTTMPPPQQHWSPVQSSPFAANFWAPAPTQDQYSLQMTSEKPWLSDYDTSIVSPTRRDSKQVHQYDASQSTGTLKRMKTHYDRSPSAILPSIESSIPVGSDGG